VRGDDGAELLDLVGGHAREVPPLQTAAPQRAARAPYAAGSALDG
jgi:hypothetical protein